MSKAGFNQDNHANDHSCGGCATDSNYSDQIQKREWVDSGCRILFPKFRGGRWLLEGVTGSILAGIRSKETPELDVQALPKLTRHTYRLEMLHMAMWGGVVAMLEGGIAAVIVAKTFHGSPFQISVVRATPVVTNMLSIGWGMLAVTRPKVPLLMVACGGAVVAMAGTALVPADLAWGGWLFALQLVLARIFLSGTATLRTAIWKANYPTAVRGRLAGRLQLQGSFSRLVSLYLSSWVLDLDPAKVNLWVPRWMADWLHLDPARYLWHVPDLLVRWGGPEAYRWLYPLLAIIGGVAIILLKFIRVRGDKQLVRQVLEESEFAAAQSGFPVVMTDAATQREFGPIEPRVRALEPYSLTAVLTPIEPIRRMIEILKRDKAFRVYQTAQMFSGAANLLIDPILVVIFTQQLMMNYTQSTLMLDIVPIILSLFTVTVWARLYDRWGLPKYRVINGGFWTIRMILTAGAVVCTQYLLDVPHGYTLVVGIFLFAQVLNGIAQGGWRDRLEPGAPPLRQAGRGRALHGPARDADRPARLAGVRGAAVVRMGRLADLCRGGGDEPGGLRAVLPRHDDAVRAGRRGAGPGDSRQVGLANGNHKDSGKCTAENNKSSRELLPSATNCFFAGACSPCGFPWILCVLCASAVNLLLFLRHRR